MCVRIIYLLACLVVAATCGAAWAEIVELRNGGQLHGEIANAEDKSAHSYVITTDGGGRIEIPRSEVARIVAQSPQQAEYARRARNAENTVAAHWKLAQWCRDEKLLPEYRAQLAKVLELDPNYEPARLALGHHKLADGWKSRHELMAGRGLIYYDGKYYTQHHIDLLEKAKQARQVDADWNNKLKRWRRWLGGSRADRAEEATRQIRAIRDPVAAPAIVNLLAEEKNPEIKRLLMEVAAGLDHPLVLDALVHISLTDPNDELRYTALDYLIATGQPGLARPYVMALRSSNNVIVNRAAESLGTIGDHDAIGPLIAAVVTKHKSVVSSGSQDQYNVTFTPSGGTSMNFGSKPPQVVTRQIENPAVLAALSKLAGANFGFNQAAWRNWLAAEAKAHPVDLRRDL